MIAFKRSTDIAVARARLSEAKRRMDEALADADRCEGEWLAAIRDLDRLEAADDEQEAT